MKEGQAFSLKNDDKEGNIHAFIRHHKPAVKKTEVLRSVQRGGVHSIYLIYKQCSEQWLILTALLLKGKMERAVSGGQGWKLHHQPWFCTRQTDT